MRFSALILLAFGLAATTPYAEQVYVERPRLVLTNFDLPVIFLQTTQRISSELKVSCNVRMVLPKDATPVSTNSLSGLVRIHGASSQGYPKKSFGLTLDTPVRWLGMRESAQWVLNAASVDRSLMRHKLSYDLFRSLSTNGNRRFAGDNFERASFQWQIS